MRSFNKAPMNLAKGKPAGKLIAGYVAFEPELWEQIRSLAAINHVSFSEQLRQMVRQANDPIHP